jgi:adenosylcobyric acid synthase
MSARLLMLQGTSSSVGKSLLTAALCRIFVRHGLRVAPFKAQNMSNNAAVCADGAEIGRAQAVQAAAARIAPTADMNPVLLKPEAAARSQVIVLGRPWRTLAAAGYQRRKDDLWPIVTASLDRLRAAYDLVVIEGAGSPVELNLRAGDIVNMAIARHADAPVLLVGDIDRGGIFAQMLGTLWLLEPPERSLVRGLLVNKFRGDLRLFADGVQILEERGGVPVLGVVPYLPTLAIPEEDAVALDGATQSSATSGIDVAVIRLPHIANFDDFDPLRTEAGVGVRHVDCLAALGRPDAIILPGTKSTVADLAWLHEQGLSEAIRQLAVLGTAVVGICGGYQMLGRVVRDPEQVESTAPEAPGLGLLPIETIFVADKATHQARARLLGGPGWLADLAGHVIEGYEIHAGRSGAARPWLEIRRRGVEGALADGAVDETGRVLGCYLHGLFGDERFRRAWLKSLGWGAHEEQSPAPSLDQALDHLADAVEQAIDLHRLEAIVGITCRP